MDVKKFFSTDWRSLMNEKELAEARRLNELCPLDRAIEGSKKWEEQGACCGELTWNIWAKAYKEYYLVDSNEGENDPFGIGKRQVDEDELYSDLDNVLDFRTGQKADVNGLFKLDFCNFRDFIFPGTVIFNDIIFLEDVFFDDAIFTSNAKFDSTKFHGSASFSHAVFNMGAYFYTAHFMGCRNDFVAVKFREGAVFLSAKFHDVSFSRSIFEGPAIMSLMQCKHHFGFSKVVAKNELNFQDSIFMGAAYFKQLVCKNSVVFINTVFANTMQMSNCNVDEDIEFTGALFYGDFDVNFGKIGGAVDLSQSCFLASSSFRQMRIGGGLFLHKVGFGSTHFIDHSKLNEKLEIITSELNVVFERFIQRFNNPARNTQTVPDFTGIKVPFPPNLEYTEIRTHPDMKDSYASAKYRKLKEIASQTMNHRAELAYFRCELLNVRNSNDHDYFDTMLVWVYEISSCCGLSALRAALWLVILILVFPFFYWFLGPEVRLAEANWFDLFRYSFHQAMPFLSLGGGEYEALVQQLYNDFNNIPWVIGIVSGFQRVVSFILEFLIGLGIRNYFKM